MAQQKMHDVLSDDVLRCAMARVIHNSVNFAGKLEWWLVSPHAAERWLQFELAYALNDLLAPDYVVVCELNRVDLVVLDAKGKWPIWENTRLAEIELKMIGNWYVKDEQISGFVKDIEKADGYKVPALALAFCIVAQGIDKGDHYSWFYKQLNSPKMGKKSFEDMKAAICNKPDESGKLEDLKLTHIELVPSEALKLKVFDSINLHLLVHRNEITGLEAKDLVSD